MIRKIFLAIAIVAACASGADAAPAIAQQVCSTSVGTGAVVFSSAPTNGNVVAVEIASDSPITMTDSNGASYNVSSTTGTALNSNVILIDGLVSGSPTATYTLSQNATRTNWCAYELSGVGYPGTYQNVRAAATPLSQYFDANPIQLGSISICFLQESNAGIFQLSFGDSATVLDQNLVKALWVHTIETTALERCLALNTGGYSDIALLYAYYSAPVGGASFIGSSSLSLFR